MNNKILLRQTSKFQHRMPIKIKPGHISCNMNSTLSPYLLANKVSEREQLRKKSMSAVCEKRLKARILEIIGSSDPEGPEKKKDNFTGGNQGHKYSRSYMHYKVISRQKLKEQRTTREDSLIKIRSLCESKLISLPFKQSLSLKKKRLQEAGPTRTCPTVKIWTPKDSCDLPTLKNFRTQPREVLTKPIPTYFQPWDKQQNQTQQFNGFLQH